MTEFTLVNVLGGLLIVTSMMVVLSKKAKPAAYSYALQSFVLVLMFVALGAATASNELFTWAGTAFVTKVLVVPAIILYLAKKVGDAGADLAPRISPTLSLVLVALEVGVCFAVVQGFSLPTALEVKPALAISLAHFFIGLTCIVTQRNIIKQVFGYCLMENGSHLTLALLAPQAPELVEVGVATDAFFAVIIMAVVAYRVYRTTGSLDAEQLMELKG
ncbi:hydrogenase 4 membrane subunit [Eggerthellaceae bacterium zg-1084]|uniref:Hydrogenase 4 membrane subunit n=1 Tax=Berryella wangjianweii TaxID=2734634 RepID=A0A6M8J723_9ACTN|nr:hydrogenase 4 membrane subunit [Berryella wangjianweii]NPD30776.1 hydrogenase 4 membrane subunit [Berryella wangjianweii]NPD32005.1 hydrogenase 4 membrane subunit [Eggerthellaceae bacterium zg-997]QKF07408.1 hydrogenase 4 membrane subunit [Berryella wangjianweii]